jgi:hypothetical protein
MRIISHVSIYATILSLSEIEEKHNKDDMLLTKGKAIFYY